MLFYALLTLRRCVFTLGRQEAGSIMEGLAVVRLDGSLGIRFWGNWLRRH